MNEFDEQEPEFWDSDFDYLRKQEKELFETEYNLHRWRLIVSWMWNGPILKKIMNI
jgi:hypothetical protein